MTRNPVEAGRCDDVDKEEFDGETEDRPDAGFDAFDRFDFEIGLPLDAALLDVFGIFHFAVMRDEEW